eukprot:TRINITY_DN17356_c0_g1_i1.p1 TRINITY_DN17356_c0_g1~~TRINITY_DN17356_c0_g1_i1.p1  ORF type:complete len:548 (-),score=136.97 TRINITY_DN17356_c0_g1_i1:55-1578(-)
MDDDLPQSNNVVGYDPYSNLFLSVWMQTSASDSVAILGQLYEEDGTPLGSPITIRDYSTRATSAPSVSFGTQWIVVWAEALDGMGTFALATRTFTSSATGVAVMGTQRLFGALPSWSPFVIYNKLTNQFAVTAVKASQGYRVAVWLFDQNGMYLNKEYNASFVESNYLEPKPQIAFNTNNNTYALVWTSRTGASTPFGTSGASSVYGLLLNGTTLAPITNIKLLGDSESVNSIQLEDHDASITYNPFENCFALVWQTQDQDGDSTWVNASHINMRIYSPEFTFLGPVDLNLDEEISNYTVTISESRPIVRWSDRTNNGIVVVITEEEGDRGIMVMSLDDQFNIVESIIDDITIMAPTGPQVGFNYRLNKFMLTWADTDDIYGTILCGDVVPDMTLTSQSSISSQTSTSSQSNTNSVGVSTRYIEIVPPYVPEPPADGKASAERVTHIVVGVLVPIFGIPIIVLGLLLFYFGYWKPKKLNEAKLKNISHELQEREVQAQANFEKPVDV